jgi:hypothetical protein
MYAERPRQWRRLSTQYDLYAAAWPASPSGAQAELLIALRQFHNRTITDRHATIHLRSDVEIVRRYDRGEA